MLEQQKKEFKLRWKGFSFMVSEDKQFYYYEPEFEKDNSLPNSEIDIINNDPTNRQIRNLQNYD